MFNFNHPSLAGTTGLASLALLAACGSGDGVPTQSFTDYETAQIALENTAGAEVATLASAIPTGNVAYSGYLGGDLIVQGRRDLAVIGAATLEVDFIDNAITGSVDNIVGQEVVSGTEQALTGSLTIDGQVGTGIAAGLVSADAIGDLTDPEGRVVGVDLDLLGEMRGANAEYITGTVTGDISADDGEGTPVDASFEAGTFVVSAGD